MFSRQLLLYVGVHHRVTGAGIGAKDSAAVHAAGEESKISNAADLINTIKSQGIVKKNIDINPPKKQATEKIKVSKHCGRYFGTNSQRIICGEQR